MALNSQHDDTKVPVNTFPTYLIIPVTLLLVETQRA